MGTRSETAPTAVIRGENLVKIYWLGENMIRALDGVDFEICAGEKVAITGPSGSGKSTLMHIIGCLDLPDSGRLLLGGEDVSTYSENRLASVRNRRIGFVFQSFNLLPRLTALENVELPLLYAGNHDAKDRARQALETVGLGHRLHHEPAQLSGGQHQRVAIARALVTNPDIILADEPTGNLDSRAGEEVMALFDTLNAQGRTIVIVTHEQSVAQHCPRQLHIHDGKIR